MESEDDLFSSIETIALDEVKETKNEPIVDMARFKPSPKYKESESSGRNEPKPIGIKKANVGKDTVEIPVVCCESSQDTGDDVSSLATDELADIPPEKKASELWSISISNDSSRNQRPACVPTIDLKRVTGDTPSKPPRMVKFSPVERNDVEQKNELLQNKKARFVQCGARPKYEGTPVSKLSPRDSSSTDEQSSDGRVNLQNKHAVDSSKKDVQSRKATTPKTALAQSKVIQCGARKNTQNTKNMHNYSSDDSLRLQDKRRAQPRATESRTGAQYKRTKTVEVSSVHSFHIDSLSSNGSVKLYDVNRATQLESAGGCAPLIYYKGYRSQDITPTEVIPFHIAIEKSKMPNTNHVSHAKTEVPQTPTPRSLLSQTDETEEESVSQSASEIPAQIDERNDRSPLKAPASKKDFLSGKGHCLSMDVFTVDKNNVSKTITEQSSPKISRKNPRWERAQRAKEEKKAKKEKKKKPTKSSSDTSLVTCGCLPWKHSAPKKKQEQTEDIIFKEVEVELPNEDTMIVDIDIPKGEEVVSESEQTESETESESEHVDLDDPPCSEKEEQESDRCEAEAQNALLLTMYPVTSDSTVQESSGSPIPCDKAEVTKVIQETPVVQCSEISSTSHDEPSKEADKETQDQPENCKDDESNEIKLPIEGSVSVTYEPKDDGEMTEVQHEHSVSVTVEEKTFRESTVQTEDVIIKEVNDCEGMSEQSESISQDDEEEDESEQDLPRYHHPYCGRYMCHCQQRQAHVTCCLHSIPCQAHVHCCPASYLPHPCISHSFQPQCQHFQNHKMQDCGVDTASLVQTNDECLGNCCPRNQRMQDSGIDTAPVIPTKDGCPSYNGTRTHTMQEFWMDTAPMVPKKAGCPCNCCTRQIPQELVSHANMTPDKPFYYLYTYKHQRGLPSSRASVYDSQSPLSPPLEQLFLLNPFYKHGQKKSTGRFSLWLCSAARAYCELEEHRLSHHPHLPSHISLFSEVWSLDSTYEEIPGNDQFYFKQQYAPSHIKAAVTVFHNWGNKLPRPLSVNMDFQQYVLEKLCPQWKYYSQINCNERNIPLQKFIRSQLDSKAVKTREIRTARPYVDMRDVAEALGKAKEKQLARKPLEEAEEEPEYEVCPGTPRYLSPGEEPVRITYLSRELTELALGPNLHYINAPASSAKKSLRKRLSRFFGRLFCCCRGSKEEG